MKEIIVGTKYESRFRVEEKHLACEVGSGEARVFSTPMLCALMENAAMNCVAQFLDGGETTVGTYILVTHSSATPVGMEVSATAEVAAVNGREICFSVTAADECGEIGRAEHKRFVVLAEKFQAKTDSKRK